MKVLIVASGRRALSEQLVEAAMGLQDRGAGVDLVSWRVVDKELYSAFANVIVLGPGGSTPRAVPRSFTAHPAGAMTSEIPPPPALSAERVKRAIAWRYRKYRSRARRTYRKYASRGRARLQRYRRHLLRIHKGLDWHPQTAWRRFSANPDAGRLSWLCDI